MYRNVCILHRSVCVCVCVCTLQIHMSTSGVVIHYRGWVCQSSNPQEVHCFKWEFLFGLHSIFQEHDLGIKWYLPYEESGIINSSAHLWEKIHRPRSRTILFVSWTFFNILQPATLIWNFPALSIIIDSHTWACWWNY